MRRLSDIGRGKELSKGAMLITSVCRDREQYCAVYNAVIVLYSILLIGVHSI